MKNAKKYYPSLLRQGYGGQAEGFAFGKTSAQKKCRNKFRTFLLGSAQCAAIVCVTALFTVSCKRASEVGLNPGDSPPAIALSDLEGKPRNLDEFKGKVVLINFWASWCAPCVEEMPALERLDNKLRDKGFTVLSVAVEDEPSVLKEFRRQFGITFPILVDSTAEVRNRYKVSGYPESFILNREGKLVLFPDPDTAMPGIRIIGPRNWDSIDVQKRLETLLAKS